MPRNRTSLGTSLNDTAQEVGTSIGTAFIGTMIAVLVTTLLPASDCSHELVCRTSTVSTSPSSLSHGSSA
jgi:hypothetical protein